MALALPAWYAIYALYVAFFIWIGQFFHCCMHIIIYTFAACPISIVSYHYFFDTNIFALHLLTFYFETFIYGS